MAADGVVTTGAGVVITGAVVVLTGRVSLGRGDAGAPDTPPCPVEAGEEGEGVSDGCPEAVVFVLGVGMVFAER